MHKKQQRILRNNSVRNIVGTVIGISATTVGLLGSVPSIIENSNNIQNLQSSNLSSQISNKTSSINESLNTPSLHSGIVNENGWLFDTATSSLLGYEGKQTDLIIPSKINGMEIKQVGNNFLKDKDIRNVDLNGLSKVTTIGDYFLSSNEINNIDLSPLSNVTTIGTNFLSSNLLQLVDLSHLSNVEAFGKSSFASNYLEFVKVPEKYKDDPSSYKEFSQITQSYTVFYSEFFSNETLELPTEYWSISADGTLSLKASHRYDAKDLIASKPCAKLIIPGMVNDQMVTKIGDNFLYDSKVTSIDLSNLTNVTEIGGSFLHSNHISSIDLSPLKNVKKIGNMFMYWNYMDVVDLSKWTIDPANIVSKFLYYTETDVIIVPEIYENTYKSSPNQFYIDFKLNDYISDKKGVLLFLNDTASPIADNFDDSEITKNDFTTYDEWKNQMNIQDLADHQVLTSEQASNFVNQYSVKSEIQYNLKYWNLDNIEVQFINLDSEMNKLNFEIKFDMLPKFNYIEASGYQLKETNTQVFSIQLLRDISHEHTLIAQNSSISSITMNQFMDDYNLTTPKTAVSFTDLNTFKETYITENLNENISIQEQTWTYESKDETNKSIIFDVDTIFTTDLGYRLDTTSSDKTVTLTFDYIDEVTHAHSLMPSQTLINSIAMNKFMTEYNITTPNTAVSFANLNSFKETYITESFNENVSIQNQTWTYLNKDEANKTITFDVDTIFTPSTGYKLDETTSNNQTVTLAFQHIDSTTSGHTLAAQTNVIERITMNQFISDYNLSTPNTKVEFSNLNSFKETYITESLNANVSIQEQTWTYLNKDEANKTITFDVDTTFSPDAGFTLNDVNTQMEVVLSFDKIDTLDISATITPKFEVINSITLNDFKNLYLAISDEPAAANSFSNLLKNYVDINIDSQNVNLINQSTMINFISEDISNKSITFNLVQKYTSDDYLINDINSNFTLNFAKIESISHDHDLKLDTNKIEQTITEVTLEEFKETYGVMDINDILGANEASALLNTYTTGIESFNANVTKQTQSIILSGIDLEAKTLTFTINTNFTSDSYALSDETSEFDLTLSFAKVNNNFDMNLESDITFNDDIITDESIDEFVNEFNLDKLGQEITKCDDFINKFFKEHTFNTEVAEFVKHVVTFKGYDENTKQLIFDVQSTYAAKDGYTLSNNVVSREFSVPFKSETTSFETKEDSWKLWSIVAGGIAVIIGLTLTLLMAKRINARK